VTVETLRRLALMHGLLAWLSAASLAIAALALARRRPLRLSRALFAGAAGATLLVTIAWIAGMFLHAPYQARLRQRIFLHDPALGWLFERKEHLSFGALGLAWCALTAAALLALRSRRSMPEGARQSGAPDRAGDDLRRAAVRAYAASAVLAAAACTAATLVARRHGF
jgi:hypothetical protein